MSKIVNLFGGRRDTSAADAPAESALRAFLSPFSIEVMPRTAAKIDSFRATLPAGTRVYVAHIDGTPIEDMVATSKRLVEEGFATMPHVPARLIADTGELGLWVRRYADVGVREALLLGGGLSAPRGAFDNSMQLLETGLFDHAGFTRLHVAGHPEGNKDIDPDGSDKNVMAALGWKQAFSERTDAEMAIVTQFAFESAPVIAWADRLAAEGVKLPIHIGVAGPTKLQTLVKFAIACGVGPSLRVLQRRAMDVTKLLLPFEPTEILTELATHKAANPGFGIAQAHVFPLGGIQPAADWLNARLAGPSAAAARA